MSAETMKIPDPIMEPATSIVASVSDMAFTNSEDGSGLIKPQLTAVGGARLDA
jgi:hypothetical protein